MEQIGKLVKRRVEHILVENEMLRAGFAAFPYLVMRDKRLSAGARLAYAFLLMYAWQEGSCFTSQKKMGAAMGVSDRHLRRFLSELKAADYIRIERKDKRFNNTYILLDKKPTKLKRSRHARPSA